MRKKWRKGVKRRLKVIEREIEWVIERDRASDRESDSDR